MTRLSTAMRVGTALAAVAVGALAFSAPAYAAIVVKPYAADSGDGCGTVSGNLGWHVAPLPNTTSLVDVTGTLVDHPRINESLTLCFDGRYSVVTFTAYHEKTVVDTDAAKVDNGQQAIDTSLTSDSTAPIDLVVVQVCRVSNTGTVPDYCGTAVHYKAP